MKNFAQQSDRVCRLRWTTGRHTALQLTVQQVCNKVQKCRAVVDYYLQQQAQQSNNARNDGSTQPAVARCNTRHTHRATAGAKHWPARLSARLGEQCRLGDAIRSRRVVACCTPFRVQRATAWVAVAQRIAALGSASVRSVTAMVFRCRGEHGEKLGSPEQSVSCGLGTRDRRQKIALRLWFQINHLHHIFYLVPMIGDEIHLLRARVCAFARKRTCRKWMDGRDHPPVAKAW